MADLRGKTIGGRYRIVELIGQGPKATVYKAYQAALERYVAIKVFPDQPPAEIEPFLARFRQEMRTVADLRHPHIAHLLDFGSEGDMPYIVTEYLPGIPLEAKLSELALRQARMPLDEVGRIGKAVADALAHAHQRGIVHGDVKPSNVLMAPQAGVILTDFGVANLALEGAAGDPIPTSAYRAPEQRRGEPGEPRSDIYALGVLLYEMATGRLPFETDTPMPPIVERIILKALAPNPAERYQKASEIAADLAGALKISEEWKPPEPPRNIVYADFVVKGKVTALLERGFSLDTGQGTTMVVSTLSRGDRLGLRPGDEVSVFGGPDPQTGIFRSGSIRKIMPGGGEIVIKDEPDRRQKRRWKLW